MIFSFFSFFTVRIFLKRFQRNERTKLEGVDLDLRQLAEAPERQGQQRLPLRYVPQTKASDRSGLADVSEALFSPPTGQIDIWYRDRSWRRSRSRRLATIFESYDRQQF